MLAHRIGQDISVEEIHSLLLATISYYLLCRLPKLHQFALMRIYAFTWCSSCTTTTPPTRYVDMVGERCPSDRLPPNQCHRDAHNCPGMCVTDLVTIVPLF